jgi:hypothetical protein
MKRSKLEKQGREARTGSKLEKQGSRSREGEAGKGKYDKVQYKTITTHISPIRLTWEN